jgi:hypothetical protein
MREGCNPSLWRVICEKFNLHNPDGSPATGLASKIAYNDFEPGREVRLRIGLRDQCTKCRRPFRKPSTKRQPAIITPARKLFNKMSQIEQDKLIEFLLNR